MKKQNLPFGMIVAKLMKSFFSTFKKRLKSEGVNYALDQLILLNAVQRNEEAVVQQDMAERMGKDKSAILRIVDSLEEDNLLQRIVNEDDRRKNNLIVTKKGLALINIFLKTEKELLEDLQKGLTKNEMDIFFKVIAKIQNNAENL